MTSVATVATATWLLLAAATVSAAAPRAARDATASHAVRSVVVQRITSRSSGWYAFGRGTTIRAVKGLGTSSNVVRTQLNPTAAHGGAAFDASGSGLSVTGATRYRLTAQVRGNGALRLRVWMHDSTGKPVSFAAVHGAGARFHPSPRRWSQYSVSFVTSSRASSLVITVAGWKRQHATYDIKAISLSRMVVTLRRPKPKPKAPVPRKGSPPPTPSPPPAPSPPAPSPPAPAPAPPAPSPPAPSPPAPTPSPTPPSSSLGTALPAQLRVSIGASYYVDGANGSDSFSTLQAQSVSTPWRTIQHALDVVSSLAASGIPGPTIFIRSAGSVIADPGLGSSTPYTSQYLYVGGLWPAASPLTITNYPGERVLVNSTFISGNYASNVRIHGSFVNGRPGIVVDEEFPVLHTGGNGVSLIGVSNYEVSGLEVRNSPSQGIYVGADNIREISSSNVQIIGNYIHNSGCYTCAPNDPTRANAPLGHDQGIYYGGTDDQTPGAIGGLIANNIVAHSFDFNIALHNAPWGTIITNNTLDGWGTAGDGTASGPPSSEQPIAFHTSYYPASIEISSSVTTAPPKNVVIKNNIGANSYYGLYYYMDPGAGATGNSEDHNLFFHDSVALRLSPATAGLTYGTDILGADPLWTGTSSGDYRLSAGSPAIGAGDAAYTPTTDFFGTPRTAADLGAVGR